MKLKMLKKLKLRVEEVEEVAEEVIEKVRREGQRRVQARAEEERKVRQVHHPDRRAEDDRGGGPSQAGPGAPRLGR